MMARVPENFQCHPRNPRLHDGDGMIGIGFRVHEAVIATMCTFIRQQHRDSTARLDGLWQHWAAWARIIATHHVVCVNLCPSFR